MNIVPKWHGYLVDEPDLNGLRLESIQNLNFRLGLLN
jgi:hypothetical protein